MANQPPPVRPWFRLASLRSVPPPAPAPAPAPAPEQRPVQTLPATFRTASAPPSPPKEPVPPRPAPATVPPPPPPPAPVLTAAQFLSAAAERDRASSSLPTSPVQKRVVPNSSSDSVAKPFRTYSPPNGSPKTAKGTVQSPKLRPTAPAPLPSPQTLPPSQVRARTEIEPRIPVEAESKTVLIQKTIDKPMSRSIGNGEYQGESGETRMPGIAHNGKHVAAKEIEGKEKGIHKKLSDPEDSGMRVITLAGENRGAVMDIVQSPKKHEFGDKPNYLHKKGNSKTKISDAESGTSSNDEANLNKKDKGLKGKTSSTLPKTAYVNSNVQCVNNSLMYHTSCKHNDPGVHLALSRKPFGEGFNTTERVKGQNN